MANHRNYSQEIVYQIGVMVLYFLAAVVALKFAVIAGNVTLVWPSSGIALALLIKYGYRYALGVFGGSITAALYAGDPLLVSALIALGNTLEPLFSIYILSLFPFSASLFRLRDYLYLIVAGSVGAIISAIIGPSTLVFANFVAFSELPNTVLHWWMGDALGLVLIAPFLLLFNVKVFLHLIQTQYVETLSLLLLTLLISLLVLTDFNLNKLNDFKGTYLLAIPLIWSIIRFGHVMTALITFLYFVIGIWGMLIHQGSFVDAQSQANLMLFWVYFMALALTSQTFAYIVSQRNTLFQAINKCQTEIYVFCEGNMQFQFANRAALDNLGLSLSEVLKLTPLSFKSLYTKEQFQELLAPLANNETASINFETLHKRSNGSQYPVEVSIQRIEHYSRKCYLASVIDISSRIEKEQHRILGNHVCDISPQAIMIVDKQRQIIRVNASFSNMTGYQADEVLGKDPQILSSGRHDDQFYNALWAEVQTKGHWQGEIYQRHKNGQLFLQDLTINVLRDPNGEIENSIVMFTDITLEREETLHLKHLAEHDLLTGLPNRALLEQEFLFAKASAKRNGHKLGLLFIDLNDFKLINDTYGHTYGDEVLHVIAERMQNGIREMDIVSRIGGDEFIVLVTNIEIHGVCDMLIDKLKYVISKPIVVNDITLQLSASIGVAKYPEHGNTLDSLLSISDSVMYEDKKTMKSHLHIM